MKVVVVCCDRLPTRLLGCYGAEWVETPNIDRLAATGVVFDNLYAERLDEGWFAEEATAAVGQSVDAALVSDRSIRDYLGDSVVGEWEHVCAAPVDDVERVPLDRVLSEPQRRVPPVGHPNFRRWVERWRRQIARDDAPEYAPDSCELLFAAAAAAWDEQAAAPNSLLWVDVAVAEADWIPPKHWRDRNRESEESELSLLDPVPGRVGALYTADDVERVASGWADRLAYFDALFGAFLQSIEESADEAPFVVFTAEQGEALGEHGFVGALAAAIHEERLHLPLVLRHPSGGGSARRSRLTTLADAVELLRSSLDESAGDTFSSPVEAERWAVISRTTGGDVLTTHDWRLIEPVGGEVELYARRDDRGDANDLAFRAPAAFEALRETLANFRGANVHQKTDAEGPCQ